MKYKGMEVSEADGRDYKLSDKPKRMLVWDGAPYNALEKEVLGFFQGRWIAANINGTGVCQWLHAAEIPTPTVRPFKSAEELDKAVTVHGPFVLGVTSGIRYLITSYGSNALSLNGDGYTMATVMREFTFLDGAPFGVVEA